MEIGKFIEQHRKLSGFTSQRQLAEKSGISSATISRIEAGIQKPNPETLKELSRFLKSTSLVELMVVAGYWEQDDLLEEPNINKLNENKKVTPSQNTNEKEFLKKLELSDDKLLQEFELTLDGKKLTEEEAKGVIAYLRSLRSMK